MMEIEFFPGFWNRDSPIALGEFLLELGSASSRDKACVVSTHFNSFSCKNNFKSNANIESY